MQKITASGAIFDGPDRISSTGQGEQSSSAMAAIHSTQSLTLPYWHLAVKALESAHESEIALTEIDWVKVASIIEVNDIDKCQISNDYGIWLQSFKHTVDCISYCVMFLEATVNNLFARTSNFALLNQETIAQNLIPELSKRKTSDQLYFDKSKLTGLSPSEQEKFLMSALISRGIPSFPYVINELNVRDRATAATNKVNRLMKILENLTSHVLDKKLHESMTHIIDFRNLLKHHKGYADLSKLSTQFQGIIESGFSDSEKRRRTDAQKLEVLWETTTSMNFSSRGIPFIPYGWVGFQSCNACFRTTKEYALQLQKVFNSLEVPAHRKEAMIVVDLFAPLGLNPNIPE